ncbi:MAG: hypothetical protein KGQ51_11725 [Planctomycetes bacterium]|nr:hypothetical protein [Planctomycetota bacterium]
MGNIVGDRGRQLLRKIRSELRDHVIKIAILDRPVMLLGDLFGMSTDGSRDMGGNRSRKVRRSGSPEVVPELRPSLDAGPSDDLFEGCSKIRIGPQSREDVLGLLFGFEMKLASAWMYV